MAEFIFHTLPHAILLVGVLALVCMAFAAGVLVANAEACADPDSYQFHCSRCGRFCGVNPEATTSAPGICEACANPFQ